MNKHCNVGKDNPMYGKTGNKNPMYGVHRFGVENPNWKGGRTISDGYVMIYKPTHPKAINDKYVYEHILVAEEMLGRPLHEGETCHHRDGNKINNVWNNIFVFESNKEHLAYERFLRKHT